MRAQPPRAFRGPARVHRMAMTVAHGLLGFLLLTHYCSLGPLLTPAAPRKFNGPGIPLARAPACARVARLGDPQRIPAPPCPPALPRASGHPWRPRRLELGPGAQGKTSRLATPDLVKKNPFYQEKSQKYSSTPPKSNMCVCVFTTVFFSIRYTLARGSAKFFWGTPPPAFREVWVPEVRTPPLHFGGCSARNVYTPPS